MTDKPQGTVMSRGAEALARTVPGGAIGGAIGGVAGLTFGAIVGFVFGELFAEAQFAHVDVRARGWYAGYRWRFPSLPAEEANDELRQNVSRPGVRAAILETMRRAFDAIDDAAAPLLGRLCADYSEFPNGRRRDGYFFGMARLLCELEADEIGEFRRVLERLEDLAVEHDSEGTPATDFFVFADEPGAVKLRVLSADPASHTRNNDIRESAGCDLRHAGNVAKTVGLAYEPNVFGLQRHKSFGIERATARRMRADLQPVP